MVQVNDIQKATKIAKAMVRSWGMSSLGPIQYDDGSGNVFLGRDYSSGSNYSGEIAYEIDKEIRKIINECYDKAKEIIEGNKDLLTLIAETLIEEETITSEQINNLVEYGSIHSPEEIKKQEEQNEDSNVENIQNAEEAKVAEEETVKETKEKAEVEKSFDDALKELTKHSEE